ncbi:DeoR family transcriptional regulator, partial [Streptomyces sp. NPDC007070]|uniref:DeoR family transcriptional regulator n=1 Tax=Streptomyces sp. NPDC007070 TaxID=3154312 RepID=UPI00340CA4E1
MAASAERRRSRILEVVRETGSIRVAELAERLDIPAVTVRRDVAVLADEGKVQRTHGSVAPSGGQPAGQGRVIGMLVPTVGQYFDEVIAGANAAATEAG